MEELIQKKDVSNEFIIKGSSPIYEPAQGGLGYEIFRSLNLNKGKTAQIFVEDGIFDSYDNLLQRCTRTAVYLKKKQLKKDDIVCLCSGNELNSMVPFIASTFVGTTYASIEPSMSDDDVIYLLNYIGRKFYLYRNSMRKKLKLASTNPILVVN
ncbi:hypothetical protein WA026_020110 [Henosepilachna vigintioctopunctata]|uniref:AMP-dependent synthetase/ligase domain-containing protein n=1 Tax=Henosepilachna vigintioctopunctata TaxID=420089 RepID=A0AAW1UB80_9CUCU